MRGGRLLCRCLGDNEIDGLRWGRGGEGNEKKILARARLQSTHHPILCTRRIQKGDRGVSTCTCALKGTRAFGPKTGKSRRGGVEVSVADAEHNITHSRGTADNQLLSRARVPITSFCSCPAGAAAFPRRDPPPDFYGYNKLPRMVRSNNHNNNDKTY